MTTQPELITTLETTPPPLEAARRRLAALIAEREGAACDTTRLDMAISTQAAEVARLEKERSGR